MPIVHFARNLLGMVGHTRRKELGTNLRAIFAATSRKQALALASEIAHKWRGRGHGTVSEYLEEHIEERLPCLAFCESHQRRIRTTNGLERFTRR
jgi:transposase-like protein